MDETAAGKIPGFLTLAMDVSAVGCAAFACLTYGTNDVLFFKPYAVTLRENGVRDLYANGARLLERHPALSERMSHPPAIFRLLRMPQFASGAFQAPFQTLFQLVTSITHLASVLALRRLLSSVEAAWFALCPAALFIAGFQGNTDPIVVACLLWAIYLAETGDHPFGCGGLVALARSVKLWPRMLVPAVLLSLPKWRERWALAVGLGGGILLLSEPYLFQTPGPIWRSGFGYRSYSGLWGIAKFSLEYQAFGVLVSLAAVLAVTISTWVAGSRVYRIVATSIASFLRFPQGVGVQCLAWRLPFCFLFDSPVRIAIYVGSTVFVASIYTSGSGGSPWYSADSLATGFSYPEATLSFSFVSWSVLAAALLIGGCRGLSAAKRVWTPKL
jgi:hypothetical protein